MAIAQGRPATVDVALVEPREIRDTRAVVGQLVAKRRAGIAARVAGVVEAVSFDVGDTVKQGQVLVELDKSRLEIDKRVVEAAVSVAEAGMRVADAKVKRAKLAYERQLALKTSTAFSRSLYDDLQQAAEQALGEKAQAEAQLQRATADLEGVRYQLKHAVILAPFSGIVIARQAQPGQYLQPGASVATLLDTENLEVQADVPGIVANDLAIGAKVTAIFESGTSKPVEVRAVVPVQNVSTRTRMVRFRLGRHAMQESHMAIGGSVTLQIPVSAPRKVITVPKDALLQGRNGWMVYVVEDKKAQPRAVELGQAVRGRMEITSGLKVGEIIVVRGNERLRPGQAVAPVQPQPTPSQVKG